MGRYYDITITAPGSTTPLRIYSSYPNGVYDPSALNVMFDMPILPYSTPTGGQTITIEGIPLQELQQSQNFAGLNLTMKAGMKAGFPLVNPNQAGTIIQGSIFQSFGNWEGTEQTLDLVLLPGIYTNDNPGNFSFYWPAGTALGSALQQTLSTAYPDYTVSINISSSLINNHDEHGMYGTLEQLASYINGYTSKNFNNAVYISIQGNVVNVTDSTYTPQPIQINFTDLIGQPTWIDKLTLQFKCVMRSDIQFGSIISMPKGLQNAPGFVTTTSASLPSSLKYQSAFQGNFQVVGLRQVGNFRSSDAAQWVTVINAIINS